MFWQKTFRFWTESSHRIRGSEAPILQPEEKKEAFDKCSKNQTDQAMGGPNSINCGNS